VSGIVVDEHQEPVAFASISLLQETDSAFVGGTTTDENGCTIKGELCGIHDTLSTALTRYENCFGARDDDYW